MEDACAVLCREVLSNIKKTDNIDIEENIPISIFAVITFGPNPFGNISIALMIIAIKNKQIHTTVANEK